MTNAISPKENNGRSPQSHDIFSAMRAEIEHMFDRFTSGWPVPGIGAGDTGVLMPSIDLKDRGKTVMIEAELPGVDEKDISVTVQDRILTIKAEKRQSKEEKGENQYVMERSFGSFVRSVRLPQSVDENKVDARFANGVLTITAEKRPEAEKPEKRIEVTKA